MRYNVWYKFDSDESKREFLKRVQTRFGFEMRDEYVKAEALMLKLKSSSISLNYRTNLNPEYETEEIAVYNCRHACEDDSCCDNYNHGMIKDDTAKDFPVRKYYREQMEQLEIQKEQKIRDVVAHTKVFEYAKQFAEECRANNPRICIDPYQMCHFEGDVLGKTAMNKIVSIDKAHKEEVENLTKKCQLVSNLVNQADTFEERMLVMKEYGIL